MESYHVKIITENGVNFTNIDEARNYWFNAGMRDGISKGILNEGIFTTTESNVLYFDTCELRIGGHRFLLDQAYQYSFSSNPSVATRYALVATVVVDNVGNVTFTIGIQNTNIPLVKNQLYKNINGAGTYQVEIGRFTLTTNGTVADVVRTLDLITGGSSGMGEHFIAGDITTTMLETGMQANVTAADIYDANGNYKQTDFSFELPETAGTVVTVNDVEQENIHFRSDPQAQLDNKVDKAAGKGLSENDYTTAEKNKLAGIEEQANKTVVDNALSSTSENPVQNKAVKSYVDERTPVGSIAGYCAATAPSGWLICDGSAISRTTYAALYAVIGTTYGAGNGSTTFNIPDYRGRTAIGAGLSPETSITTYTLGRTGGSKDAVVVSHFHRISANDGSPNGTGYGYGNAGYNRIDSFTVNTNIGAEILAKETGENGTDKNMMPYTVQNYIIKY